MKKSLKIFLIFVILTTVAFVSAGEIDEILKYFKAETSTDKVIVKWSTKKEAEVKEFVIQRSMDEFTYTDLKKQKKIGENKEYQHIDNTLFKSSSRICWKEGSVFNSSTSGIPDLLNNSRNRAALPRRQILCSLSSDRGSNSHKGRTR